MSTPRLVTAHGVLLVSRYGSPNELSVMGSAIRYLQAEVDVDGFLLRIDCDSKAGAFYTLTFAPDAPPESMEAATDQIARYLVCEAGGHNGIEGERCGEPVSCVGPQSCDEGDAA